MHSFSKCLWKSTILPNRFNSPRFTARTWEILVLRGVGCGWVVDTPSFNSFVDVIVVCHGIVCRTQQNCRFRDGRKYVWQVLLCCLSRRIMPAEGLVRKEVGFFSATPFDGIRFSEGLIYFVCSFKYRHNGKFGAYHK